MYGNQYPPQGPPPPGYFQNNPFPPPGKPKDNPADIWKVVGINFGIFALYQVFLILLARDEYMGFNMFLLIIHWFVMLVLMIIAFSIRRKMAGFGWLISLVALMIIGFSSCWWIADMVGGNLRI